MDGCYLDFYSPCEKYGKCGWVEKEEEQEEEEGAVKDE